MSLGQHLALQLQRLEQLSGLLTEEQRALSHSQVDGQLLSRLAGDKQALLAQLANFESQRRQAQIRLGYGQDMTGAEQAARESGCLPQWHALLASAQRIAQLNQLNGSLISHRLEHNQRMLNFLHEAAGQPLYGPNGQSKKRAGSLASKA